MITYFNSLCSGIWTGEGGGGGYHGNRVSPCTQFHNGGTGCGFTIPGVDAGFCKGGVTPLLPVYAHGQGGGGRSLRRAFLAR